MEIQRYLKTGSEFKRGSEVIQRNTNIVQSTNTSVGGHLCLFVLSHIMLLMLFVCIITSAIEITIRQLEKEDVTEICKRKWTRSFPRVNVKRCIDSGYEVSLFLSGSPSPLTTG